MKPETPAQERHNFGQNAPLIALSGIQKLYDGQCVLQDFSLTLQPGEICGFVGANGGGKTTAMRIISGLLQPNQGSGSVLGFDLIAQAKEIRCTIGYMTQHHALYKDLTVEENLQARALIYDLPEPQAVIEALHERLELASVRNKRVGTLSGGWARRAQFAAAILHSPRLVLLDEPTTGLDIHSREMLWKHISQLAEQSIGCIISTHDLYEAERCSTMAVFVQGHIVAIDSPKNLMASQKVNSLEAAILQLTR